MEVYNFVATLLVEIIQDVVVAKEFDDAKSFDNCSAHHEKSIVSSSSSNGEKATELVENMMREWSEDPILKDDDWSYTIEYIDKASGERLDYRAYEAKWSRPMEGCANPVLAVVVFVFVKTRAEDSGVQSYDINYVFEGHRFVHDSSERFRPAWLVNAYESKKRVLESFISYL